jgi:hypothetical protein
LPDELVSREAPLGSERWLREEPMRANLTIWTIAAAACALGTGCDARKAAEASSASGGPPVASASAPPVRIIATDAGFDAPDSIPAGLRHIVFENRGTEIHEAMLVKLPDGMSSDDYVAAVRGGADFPEGALDYSGPGLTSPGETVEIWLRVDSGRYILVCWNSGHATSRPVHNFTVRGSAKDDEPPPADVVLREFDFRFQIEGSLKKGAQVIRVETPGPSMHEVDVFRLVEGRTVDDVRRWRKDGGRGVPPARALGGVLDSHDVTRVVWLRRTFTPGRYVLHCEMPMPGSAAADASGTEVTHADVGMVLELEIAE